MTNGRDVLELRVLGPLEAAIGGEAVPLGGAKQRAVLAVLLLRRGEVVPVERLVDEIWGDRPPPSAVRALESYVSRLRQILNGHGPTLTRRGRGYVVELGGAALDAVAFGDLHDRASDAVAEGDHGRVVELTRAALALWRGPALADVVLASAGRAEAERLEEARLRTYELLYDAELALDRHERVVGELRALVRESPYRERFVAQLMLALYRSGRHADALDVYERTRDALSRDLGLQPSVELRRLSGQIVRQDPRLGRPAAAARVEQRAVGMRGRARRVADLVLVCTVVASVMALGASGSAPHASVAAPVPEVRRVALVLPASPQRAGALDARVRDATAAFREATRAWRLETEILVADETRPRRAEVERLVQGVVHGGFGSVLVLGDGAAARALAPTVRALTNTRFVFLDASLSSLSLEGAANATGFRYAVEEPSRLAGYLSGLVAPRGGSPTARPDVVSVVAAPRTETSDRVARAFARGVGEARQRTRVEVGYAHSVSNKTACERIANRQIDAGSDLVLATGGACAHAALAVARARGVWGIRFDQDATRDGPHILATISKWWEKSVTSALTGLELQSLPSGRDVVLGLADDYAVDMFGEGRAAATVWSKVVELCSVIRQRTDDDAP